MTHAIEHIVSTPGVCGGKPRIAGTRLTVEFLSVFTDGSRSVDNLAADYGITPAQIHAAWSYYYDHRAEIDAQMAAAEGTERSEEMARRERVAHLKARHRNDEE